MLTDSSSRFGSLSLFRPWFPEVDPDDPRSQGWLRKLSERKVTLIVHQVISGYVLLFNLTVTIYAVNKHGITKNIGDILEPSSGTNCDEVKQYNKLLHFAINVLSTILLGSSNYCAQLLVAPTRKEVDKAHKRHKWFDIGVQSTRNLWRIDKKRRITWFCLMISSGLLHLV